jgi:phosphate ABC transporter phosphate-binding protein
MRPYRSFLGSALLTAIAFAASTGCSGCNKTGRGNRITAGGATFVDPLMQEWAKEYNKAAQVEIDYTAQGSGFGIKQTTDKNFAFGCSDAPMNKKEYDAATAAGGELIHVPLTIGAVAVVFNLPDVKDLQLSGDVLAGIFMRKITKWNDGAIAALNTGAKLPDLEITPVTRAEDSGTTSIFTEYLSKVNAEFKAQIGTSKKPT